MEEDITPGKRKIFCYNCFPCKTFAKNIAVYPIILNSIMENINLYKQNKSYENISVSNFAELVA